jgi:tetratricopeptide (TPR) repeat protein
MRSWPTTAAASAVSLCAIVAAALWPSYVGMRGNDARAAALPTMAPVTADYQQRDRLVAFWERATREHHRGDMISPRMLAEQYLLRYREHYDIDDVVRAEAAARASLSAEPRLNLAAELELASIQLTLHRFHDALATTHQIESWDAGDVSMRTREASLQLEVGDMVGAERNLDAVPERDRDDGWSVVNSRRLELTGHLDAARALLARAAAYQNSNFDAPAVQRAWYFFRQGEMAFEAGDNDAAKALEHQAIAVYPGDADALRTLARIECAQHAWADCLRDASASAAIVPYPETLGYEADAQDALGDHPSADATRDLIARVEVLGDTQHITDRLTAIYDADHLVRLDRAYAIARNELHARDDIFTEDTLAWAAAMDGHWDVARGAIAKADRWHTQNALIAYHAGRIDEHFGNLAAAKAEYASALALNASFHPVFADDARKRIAAL